ncbi:alkaline phosphatase [Pseudonocardiaceae bacterium YIM PH 21723]|nr:alkaline phosphatase [Pseudonocardiaceae bacterium YIM PH 21723]
MRKTLISIAAVAGVGLLAGTAIAATAGKPGDERPNRTEYVRDMVRNGPARNVILLIGDGMGDSEITLARNYEKGAAGRLPGLDELPMTGSYTTYAVEKGNPAKVVYNPESASTASAWSTGKKTYNGAISVDAHGVPQATMMELAKKKGLRTGNVTTAEVQDATPAAQGAHVVSRDCKGPDNMKNCPAQDKVNGGIGSIAEQFVENTRTDVILGGGKRYFEQKVKAGKFAGKTVTQQAQENGYQIVTDKAGLDKQSGDKPVIGMFHDSNMEVEWTGPLAVKGGTQPSRCTPNPKLPQNVPHLDEMANKAIKMLNRPGGKGFFLQVEGASIDKRDHAADPCGQIGETVAFDKAVKAALDFAKYDGNTTVLVSADHAHTSQIISDAVSPGKTATLVTNEGSEMYVNYATSDGESQDHTGTQVRVAGYGPQAANVVGRIDQTDIFYMISRALELKR